MNTLIAVISGESLVWLVVTVLVVGLIYWLVQWGIAAAGIPEPFSKVAKFIAIIAAVVFLINALLSVGGHGFIRW